MKKKYLSLCALVAGIVIVCFTVSKSNQFGAQAGLVGAPDDIASNACGNVSCHHFNPIINSNSLVISLIDPNTTQAVTKYKAGVKYTVRIELTRASLKACGFESAVEKASDNSHIGTINPKLKCQYSDAAHQYVTHNTPVKTSAGYGKWEYYWTAPTASQGDVTIYAAGNSANNDGSDNGDTIFTTNSTFGFDANSAIQAAPKAVENVSVYPNPVHGMLSLSYTVAAPDNVCIELYTIEGQLVRTLTAAYQPQGLNKFSADVTGLAKGLYFVKVSAGREQAVEKFLAE